MKSAWLLAAVSSAACWRSQTPAAEPPVSPIEVTVSSVTLGDDCGRLREELSEADCVQTSLQLAVKAGEAGGSLRVKRIDLYVPDGDVVTIHAHTPTRWINGVYRPWNQQVSPNQRLKVSYGLESPDWNRLGGRWSSYARTFQVKVTLEVDANEQTFETRTQVAAIREPMIET